MSPAYKRHPLASWAARSTLQNLTHGPEALDTRTQVKSNNFEGRMDPSQEPYDGLRAILAHPELMVSTSFANPPWTKRCL